MIDVETLHPGDLFVLPGEGGYWDGVYEFVRPDDDPEWIVGTDVATGELYRVKRADAIVPAFSDEPSGGATEPETLETPPHRGDQPLTADQRRMIFGLGKKRGLDLNDLRAMTPMGSVSALTRTQASRLVDRLLGRSACPSWGGGPQGTATAKQLGLIVHLCERIGLDDVAFGSWLHRQFKVACLDEINDVRLASRLIGGLLKMQENFAARGRRSGTR